MDPGLDPAELALLTDTLRRTMRTARGAELDAALTGLGWPDLLTDAPVAVPLVFRLLGETGSHAAVLLDVLRHAGAEPGGLPFAGGGWVEWSAPAAGTDSVPSAATTGDARAPAAAGLLVTSAALAGGAAAGDGRERDGAAPAGAVDEELPVRRVVAGVTLPVAALAAGRRALGWWLLGTGHAMLTLARAHALERTQFGRPLASFQAVRHRLAETLVTLDGAEAALLVAEEAAPCAAAGRSGPAAPHAALDARAAGSGGRENARSATRAASVPGAAPEAPDRDDASLAALLAKAAAGQAALTAARHCQQVLGGIGFTAEHGLHRHVRRALVLDGLLGSARELTREAGSQLRAAGTAPRLAQL